jgi:hypothetical protein
MMNISLLLQGARVVIFFGALLIQLRLGKIFSGIWESRATLVTVARRKTALRFF